MQQKNIIYEGATIYYTTGGKGLPVLLLHGFGEDGTVWQRQVEALQQHYFLIVPDIPGSGKSAVMPYADIEEYAEVVKAIIDTELPQLVQSSPPQLLSFIGHSMGGYITLAFAEKYPQYLRSFGLIHSSAFADPEEKKIMRKKAIEFIKENGATSFLKTSIQGLFNPEYADDNKEAITELLEKAHHFSAAAVIQYYEAMIARPDRTSVLTNFSKPVLFIIGEHDKAIPLESSLQQCYLPAVSFVHILDKAAHMGMFEETAKVNGFIQQFLQQG